MTRLAVLVFVVATLFGCGSGNKLIGSWTDAQGDFTERLKEDGTFTFEYGYQGSQVMVKGNWTYVGTKLHLEPKSVDITGGTDIEIKREALKKTVMKDTDATLQWGDDDHFVGLDATGGQIQMQRKK